MLLNLVFSLLAIFHLTYLGSMFDAGADEQEIEEVRVNVQREDIATGSVEFNLTEFEQRPRGAETS